MLCTTVETDNFLGENQATMGVYPFMFGAYKDFVPIIEELTKVSATTLLCNLVTVKDPANFNVLAGRRQRAVQLGRLCAPILAKGRRACLEGS